MCYSKDHWNALTDGSYKYIYYAYDGREQLFDLRNDPGELYNLAKKSSHQNTLRKWRQRMIEHLSERGEEFISNGKLTTRKKRMLYSPLFPKKS
jgi:arylsulfatase A-like enzyme